MRKECFRILIVGCGNLGSRHLQAVASLPFVKEIEVVDPRQEALERGKNLLTEISPNSSDVSFQWLSSIEKAKREGDLCIVATQAHGRCELIQQIYDRLGIRVFLIEKIVSPSVAEYETLLGFSKKYRLAIWVNCKMRGHLSHHHVKQNLVSGEPLSLHVSGGNHGLANNGLHVADLFCFLDNCRRIKLGGCYIDPLLHPSKRGKDIFDLSGTLLGYSEKGSQLTLSFSSSHDGPTHFSIVTPSYRAIVDDYLRWLYESKKTSNWIWERVPFEANLMVSHMTKTFVSDILRNGKCALPTLEECFPAHRFILENLQPYFNQLLGKNLNVCPVT